MHWQIESSERGNASWVKSDYKLPATLGGPARDIIYPLSMNRLVTANIDLGPIQPPLQ